MSGVPTSCLSILLRPFPFQYRQILLQSISASCAGSSSMRSSPHSPSRGVISSRTLFSNENGAFAARGIRTKNRTTRTTSTTTTPSSSSSFRSPIPKSVVLGGVGRGCDIEEKSRDVLLLEGDTMAVSHDGVARTGYHLVANPLLLQFEKSTHVNSNKNQDSSFSSLPFQLAVEELYDIPRARKTFALRRLQTATTAPILAATTRQPTATEQGVWRKQEEPVGMAPLGESLVGGCWNIQEIPQQMLGAAGTGATTWEASIAMGLYLAAHPQLLHGHVLELGCGVGLGFILSQKGATATALSVSIMEEPTTRTTTISGGGEGVTSITLTDGSLQVLEQCRQNLKEAFPGARERLPPIDVQHLKWEWVVGGTRLMEQRQQQQQPEEETKNEKQQLYDTIIACDVAYLQTQLPSLVQAMTHLLAENGQIHIFGPYNRDALQQLCRLLQEEPDFEVHMEYLELERYRLFPYKSPTTRMADSNNGYQSKSRGCFLHATSRRKRDHAKDDLLLINEESSMPEMNDID